MTTVAKLYLQQCKGTKRLVYCGIKQLNVYSGQRGNLNCKLEQISTVFKQESGSCDVEPAEPAQSASNTTDFHIYLHGHKQMPINMTCFPTVLIVFLKKPTTFYRQKGGLHFVFNSNLHTGV